MIVKYAYKDAYLSLIEALKHSCYRVGRELKLHWVDARRLGESELIHTLHKKLKEHGGGVLVPGGFGDCGVENKMNAIRYARENDIPFLGICYGMQLMAIEFARNVLGIRNANTQERDASDKSVHIVHIIDKEEKRMGGTMRLGTYDGVIRKGSLAEKVYGGRRFEERHRHRYEINTAFCKEFEEKGLHFTGTSGGNVYMEIAEIPTLRFFMGVQYHPEYESTMFKPNPVISAFVDASRIQKT